jgi:hypothetical protein
MSEMPSRRWLRFSLRALLVVITLLCLWLGWETSIVHERKRLLSEAWQLDGIILVPPKVYTPPKQAVTVPYFREWLEDESVSFVFFNPKQMENFELLKRMERAFPEAEFFQLANGPYAQVRPRDLP